MNHHFQKVILLLFHSLLDLGGYGHSLTKLTRRQCIKYYQLLNITCNMTIPWAKGSESMLRCDGTSVPIIKPYKKPNLQSELCLINMGSENGTLAYIIQGIINFPTDSIQHTYFYNISYLDGWIHRQIHIHRYRYTHTRVFYTYIYYIFT